MKKSNFDDGAKQLCSFTGILDTYADRMEVLSELPNIGETLAAKLNQVGIMTQADLVEMGAEKALLRIATLENSGVCINMLYALEGAIRGIRWHGLDKARKKELLAFYRNVEQGT